MMVQTLIPCSPASKTEEILSRYRPIAPKPELPANSDGGGGAGGMEEAPHKIKHSPYIRNIWAHLQARPTRTRKRGRSSTIAPALKRHHHHHKIAQTPFLGLCCPSPLSFISHNSLNGGLQEKPITLPLLSSPSPSSSSQSPPVEISFSRAACQAAIELEEKDLILQLKSPISITNTSPWSDAAPHVIIAPKPIRPIGSTIRVGPISPTLRDKAEVKRPEEVEAEVEAEEFPAVVTDSNNKVRMVNSAYKEMVGQPECRWLDSLSSRVAGRRISGEVMLQMPSGPDLARTTNGFSCWARIEWGRDKEKESVDALCDVVRLCCESKYYWFSWRFHTKHANMHVDQ